MKSALGLFLKDPIFIFIYVIEKRYFVAAVERIDFALMPAFWGYSSVPGPWDCFVQLYNYWEATACTKEGSKRAFIGRMD